MEPGRPTANRRNNPSWHIHQTRKFPALSAEVEQALWYRWRDHHDISAAYQLTGSHLHRIVKLARDYRGYGLPSEDLIGEGHVGMMRAVCRYDPDRGIRFATYAIWWMRAAIQEYILHNWSLVKMGTTVSQRRLLTNLRRLRGLLREFDDRTLSTEAVNRIADVLQVPEYGVISMNQRMVDRDRSLNAPIDASSPSEWHTLLMDDSDDRETALADREEAAQQKSTLLSALRQLTTRERHIVGERYLRQKPTTLEALSQHYGVSSERIRQIEVRALLKL